MARYRPFRTGVRGAIRRRGQLRRATKVLKRTFRKAGYRATYQKGFLNVKGMKRIRSRRFRKGKTLPMSRMPRQL